jgi:MFS family permease
MSSEPTEPLLLNTSHGLLVAPTTSAADNSQLESDQKVPCCHPSTRLFRSLILFLACTLTFGSYFSYDNPGALTSAFKLHICQNSTAKYEWMYSIYSWPNTIQPFLGGYIIDNVLGVRRAAVIFCSLIALGTAIVALSTTIHFSEGSLMPFYVAIVGRFVFGLGGESLTVTQNTFVARWFSGAELATAFAICLSFSRIGSALNFAVEKPIANSLGFSYALWASAVFCVVSTLAGLLLSKLDKMGEEAGIVGRRKKKKSQHTEEKQRTEVEDEKEGAVEEEEEEETDEDDANWRDVGKVLRCRETLMYGICMSFYVAVFVFITIASSFFQRKYKLSPKDANTYVAIPYTVSAVISPFLGFIIDSIGYSVQWVFLASVSLSAIHLSFALTNLSPFAVMIWMGCTYSLCAASLWPMVALIVDLKQLGTAYGLMTALQNLGLAVAPLIIGPLVEDDQLSSYIVAEYIFSSCSALSALFCIILIIADGTMGDGLLYSSSRRIKRILAKRVKMKRRLLKNKRRRKERQLLEDRSGYGATTLTDGRSLEASWQSTTEGISNSPGDDINGLLSPRTATEMRSTYLRKLDILLRRKGGLS